MRKVKLCIMLLAAVPMLMMIGCKKEAQNTSRVTFKLTDAPGEYDAVNVEIKGVQVHSQTEGWVTFNSSLGVVNLLDYMNGETTLLAEGEIAAGAITEARLILGTNNSVVIDGTTFPLVCPSALQSGLKIIINSELNAGSEYEWTIDFDAAQSVVVSATGNYILKPTLRLIVDQQTFIQTSAAIINDHDDDDNADDDDEECETTVINAEITGNISGSVNSAIGMAVVYATDASGHVTSTITGVNGNFTISAVHEGTYSIKVDPILPLVSSKIISNISVAAGQTTNLGLVAM